MIVSAQSIIKDLDVRNNNLRNKNIIEYLPTILEDLEYLIFDYPKLIQKINRIEYYEFNNSKLQTRRISYLATLISKYMSLKWKKKFEYKLDKESISKSTGSYKYKNDYIVFETLSMLLYDINISDDIKVLFHEFRHTLQYSFLKENELEKVMSYPSNFITIIKNMVPVILEKNKLDDSLDGFYMDNYKKLYLELDAENYALEETKNFLVELYSLYPNKNRKLENKVIKVQSKINKEMIKCEKAKNMIEIYEDNIYAKEAITTKEITSKLKYQNEKKDSLIFIDELFKNNIDKLRYFKILGIYLIDGRLKSYSEIMEDKERLLEKYDRNKVNEVYDYIIKSNPSLLLSKYIIEKDENSISFFLENHPTYINKYKEVMNSINKNKELIKK